MSRLKDLYYKLRAYWYRYTTIKSRYLPHTWRDKDEILEMTAFEILQRFIEDESYLVKWDDVSCKLDGNTVNVMEEWQKILAWFDRYRSFEGNEPIHHAKPPQIKFQKIDDTCNISTMRFIFEDDNHKEEWHKAIEEQQEFEERITNEMTENLIKIVKLRKYMWS